MKNMSNVFTSKKKIPYEGKAWENSLSRRTKKKIS